jgi:hypothetical protein
MWLTQFLEQHGVLVIPVSLTLAALGFSIFGTIYSNLIHNAEMAEGNLIQRTVGTRAYSYWCKASKNFRELAKLRAYTANLFFWSLVAIIVSLIAHFAPWPEKVCPITFIIAVSLLIIAIVIVPFKCECLLKLLWIFRLPVKPRVEKLTEDC